MKILHTADWQLGCAFSSFGLKASVLRSQRLATLRRALELARERRTDAFLIAGDLFEDNQVAQSLLTEVAGLFASMADLRIIILPGNHDPVSGPGCIWLRPPFVQPPPNVTVIREPVALPLEGGYLLANPIRQKLSTQDPSVRLAELAATIPAGALKIGMTHGALAIEGKHQPNDHPIHVAAASRSGLEYLAIGHWHQWQSLDGGRMIMPGTPEPDAFDHSDGRYVALVELDSPGAPPRVEQVEIAGLTWREFQLDLLDGEPAQAILKQQLAQLRPAADQSVVRVALKGRANRRTLSDTRAWLETALQPFLAAEVQDSAALALSANEIAAWTQSHPLLAQVFADLTQARIFGTGRPEPLPNSEAPLPYPEFQRLASELELDPAELDDAFFQMASDLLASQLPEVCP